LPLDLAAYDDCVIGDDRSDPAQIDWHIAAPDGAGDDRYRRRCRWRRRSPFSRAPMGQDETGDGEDDHKRGSENCNSSSHHARLR
jgi:hypothetical protein